MGELLSNHFARSYLSINNSLYCGGFIISNQCDLGSTVAPIFVHQILIYSNSLSSKTLDPVCNAKANYLLIRIRASRLNYSF